jgi:hypothetical protein
MIDFKIDERFLECGFKVLKSEKYDKYDEGILELPVKWIYI